MKRRWLESSNKFAVSQMKINKTGDMKCFVFVLLVVSMMACSSSKDDWEIKGMSNNIETLSLEEKVSILEQEMEEERLFLEDNSVIICPKCNSSNVSKIAYGLICLDQENAVFKEKVNKKEIILGGCVVRNENCHCNKCEYEWKWTRK